MKQLKFLCTAIALCLLAATSADARPPIIYNTGVDNAGNVLPDLSLDPHYVGAGPSGSEVVQSNFSATPGSNTTSSWIRPATNFGPGSYAIETTFNWPAASPIVITGQWAAFASGVDISINGVGTGATTPNPGNLVWTPFSVSGNAVAGVNTLDFKALEDFSSPNVGLRVEIFSVVPEPASLTLTVLGAGVILSRRRLS